MISASSRYANNVVAAITDQQGVTRQTILANSPASRTLLVLDYTWSQADRVDLLAAQVFGDETMWWVIANANPAILDWTSVQPGTVIRVPNAILS